ncbi:NAD-dependent epimerase/dehydratase family protein [Planococcus lenghuensis]|uniref:NAD-dependent dehydratase n=1 Tax=Planococcus lenghuensis TaxID=2213202 RepID=A0A1Q2L0I8_9BACL|nr:NAD-dependent epimerase/dehydratase family protein [Planococcus lenghuensis]AQQ53958.1 NAD-dependent dehydratase [Planococcus lenghuensis]
MKLLILGGTSFVGRHITETAVKQGHDITLFNRGKSQPNAFPELRRITGDRRMDANKLAGEKWDAVIDVSAYSPADLEPVLRHVETDRYTFISTISVYDDFSGGPAGEDASLHKTRPDSDQVTGETYGPLKIMCEELIRKEFGEKALVIRPGIVAGPFDPTDRFTYWAVKLAEKGTVIIPGSADRKVQWIAARDLAQFTVTQTAAGTTGTFNVTADPVAMGEFVDALDTGGAEKIWVSDEALKERNIQPFEIPLWIPVSPEYPEGFLLADNRRAKQAGLEFTPLAELAADTRKWFSEESRELKTGLSDKQESVLQKL